MLPRLFARSVTCATWHGVWRKRVSELGCMTKIPTAFPEHAEWLKPRLDTLRVKSRRPGLGLTFHLFAISCGNQIRERLPFRGKLTSAKVGRMLDVYPTFAEAWMEAAHVLHELCV